jgi:hypothetical protein
VDEGERRRKERMGKRMTGRPQQGTGGRTLVLPVRGMGAIAEYR